MYAIVIHGIPIADLDTTKMADAGVIKRLEAENKSFYFMPYCLSSLGLRTIINAASRLVAAHLSMNTAKIICKTPTTQFCTARTTIICIC